MTCLILCQNNDPTPNRKRSIQSYQKFEQPKIDEYAVENPGKSYKSSKNWFYKRESKSNSSSRTKIVPCRTPNAIQNQPCPSSNSMVAYVYSK